MQIITLTTDWGSQDFYGGMVKGCLYNRLQDINIVDITHDVEKYSIQSAAFIVKNACFNFPEGTIHIIDVNTFECEQKQFIVVKAKNQYFICTDNGLPSLVFAGMDVEIYATEHVWSETSQYTFGVWEKFCKVAIILATAKTPQTIGTPLEKFNINSTEYLYRRVGNDLICNVIYIDDYGNCFLSITDEELQRECQGHGFELKLEGRVVLREIVSSYQDTKQRGDALLTVSVTHNLELAMRESNFARLNGYKVGTEVRIKIKP